MSDCCHPHDYSTDKKRRFDFIFWGSIGIIAVSLILHFAGLKISHLDHFAHTVLEFLGTMWWGILFGIVVVGLMAKLPKEYFNVLLGRGDSFGGILRATFAGLLLDLCSHGILMVGAKLYERGASTAQVMTFLIASPWNSFSLTLILVALIGLKWTLIFIAGSVVVAIITGVIFQKLEMNGVLPTNPNTVEIPKDFSIKQDAKQRLKGFKFTPKFFTSIFTDSVNEARILVRWLLLGVVIAAAMRAFIPPETFSTWFGPTLVGLLVTLVVTTIIEVCSEGSTPIAAEIFNSAHAPGNAFTFLMAGVSTDYTEIMVLKETTKSWKVALFLPLVTAPQVLLLGYIMNIWS